jgi:hypothetical protein
MVCLKLDLYNSKYANMPITYSVKPCPPGKGYVDNTYGEGTVFNGFNAMGRPEEAVITEVVPLEKVVMTSGSATMTHTMTALPGGKCRLEVALKWFIAGIIGQDHVKMQVNTMKHFIEANVRPICNDAPPIGRQSGDISEFFKAAPTTKQTAFCGNCGKANTSKDAFCGGCGAPNGGAATGGDPPREGFVEIPQHAEAKQAALNMMQASRNRGNGGYNRS